MRNNLPSFLLDENVQNRRIQPKGCEEASVWIDQADENKFEASDCVECRICQEEDKLCHLEIPCSCRGSMKYAHHKCVQRWCNQKGDTSCEICNQPYKSGFIFPVRTTPPSDFSLQFRGEWATSGVSQSDFHVLAVTAAQEFGEFAAVNSSASTCCRSAAVLLMAILLLRHAFAMASAQDGEDASTVFALFLLRAAGFLLPCYMMARIMKILHRRRQREVIDTLPTSQT